MSAPYPLGMRLALDADTRLLEDGSLFGGSPRRILRLSAAGDKAWAELVNGPVTTPDGARLARRLTDNGLLHPVITPAPTDAVVFDPTPPDVTVVIPVRDRPVELGRCLAALDPHLPVLVIDDASQDPPAIAAVCAAHNATVISRAVNGGPAAARMTALSHIDTEFLLFLDSDTVPPRHLLSYLRGHLADPLVGAVAPRIRSLPGPSTAARYGMAAGSLDLGDRPARVTARARVSYVPTAALLMRRVAFEQVGGFDTTLRYGEDVDMVWRLDAAGWRVRYEPAVSVQHAEPARWIPLLRRRFRYGTSAGPLARRHPGNLTPLVVHGWSSLAVLGVLTRRPSLTLAGLAGSTVALRRTLGRLGLGRSGAHLEAAKATAQSWNQLGRAGVRFGAPLLAVALFTGGQSRRVILSALVVSGPLVEWCSGPRSLHPVAFVAGRIADDVAYGAGVIAGSVTARAAEPVRPVFTRRLLRISPNGLRLIPSAPGPSQAAALPSARWRPAHA